MVSKVSLVHHYPFTDSEEIKVMNYLKNSVPMVYVDDEISFERVLSIFDFIFGKFIKVSGNSIILRGKFDYKGKITDSSTGEKQVVYTVSNPKSLYRPNDSDIYFVRVPEKSWLTTGFYAETKIDIKTQSNPHILFVENEDITPINFEANIPTLFLDYTKFNDVFGIEYGFDMSETTQKYRRNIRLSNLDLMLMSKLSGENFHNDVKGAVNCSVIKTTHDQDMYNLEVVDEFLDNVTIAASNKSVFNKNLIHCGTLSDFATTLNKNNRLLSLSPYKNFYGCNIGFSLKKSSNIEKDRFVQNISNSSIDYLNPINKIITLSRSTIRNLLNANKEHIFSSRVLFIETQLLPLQSKISEICNINPKILRTATILKKFEECIDNLGTDEILPKLKISENNIRDASKFLEDNKKDVEEFILEN